jgi:type I restriction-modification system DNA methylase subunit
MRDFNDHARPPPTNYQKELVKLIRELSHRHSHWQVFSDFVEMGATAISNAVDHGPREKREARYMEIVKRYKPEEVQKFPQMLAALTMALEQEPGDVLGRTFHDLELHNKYTGQFFSPDHLCRMMAKMMISEGVEEKIAARGFVTAQEPAVGGGAMIIALANELQAANINYQKHLHVTATDVDAKCVHMAYLQMSLLHIPAIIVHGNSLTLEEIDHWYTPAHIMGGWKWKLVRRPDTEPEQANVIERPPVAEPRPEPERQETQQFQPAQLTLF